MIIHYMLFTIQYFRRNQEIKHKIMDDSHRKEIWRALRMLRKKWYTDWGEKNIRKNRSAGMPISLWLIAGTLSRDSQVNVLKTMSQ